MKLKAYAVVGFLRQWSAVATCRALVGDFAQIVGLEFDAVELLVAAQARYFFVALFFRHYYVAVFILCEFVVKFFLGDTAAVFFLGAEFFGNGECGHDRGVVDIILFDLVGNFEGICKGFGNIGENRLHLGRCLEPLLL